MNGQRGSAVLMAMLIVAAVATLVAGAMWQQNALMRETAAEAAHAQARWLIRGAIDWAGVILREDARTSSVDHKGEPWAVPLADTRLNENDGRAPAYIAGFVQDEQAKFNLRNLAASGTTIERKELETLERLLGALGVNSALAEPIARRMQEALAAAAERKPALALASVEEALRVEGVDAQVMERLREFVTVLPERTIVNANTAAAEVLAAQVPGLGVSDARRLANSRDNAYFRDLAEVRARIAQAGVPANDAELAVATRYFSVEGMVTYGGARLRARALLKRDAGALQMLSLRELE